ncbi:HEPN domain-containing protein [Halorientalis halophila]|uniref:ApeA N-terminal domain 1-containing protein n=1 Tax=Halorientalis halophila TaxID=3108499 RepID=UPI0030086B7C
MEEDEIRGYWWLEKEPDEKIPGKLIYSPNDFVRLYLLGDFSSSYISSGDNTYYSKILGVSAGGDDVTLLKCRRDKQNRGGSGPITSEYISSYYINGHRFERQRPSFHSMSVSFYGMDNWAMKSSPTPQVDDDAFKDIYNQERFPLEINVPKPDSAWVKDYEYEISLRIRPRMNIEKFQAGELEVRHEFKIDPRRTQVPFEEYLNHINKLNNFVAFGIGEPVHPNRVTGTVRHPDNTYSDTSIYYPIQGEINRDPQQHPYKMLFNGTDIRSDFTGIMQSWYERSDELSDIFELYFGTLFQEKMYTQNQFLSLCHGLESYHRMRLENNYMLDSDYDDFYQDMISVILGNPEDVFSDLPKGTDNIRQKHDIPDALISSMKYGTLKYANEKSLRRRLDEIVDFYRPVLQDLPYSITGKIGLVVDTRNYYSHYTDELAKKAASRSETQTLIWGLQQLIETCLLVEIGIPLDLIQQRLQTKYKNRWVSS